MDKFILDVTCGGKTIWFNKNHPNCIYGDIRKEEKGFYKHRKKFEVNPDIILDFRKLEFPDNSFKLVFFDPPHIYRENNKSWVSQKYGMLNSKTWKRDLKQGFDECMSVLEERGNLVFKWSEPQIKIKEILEIFGEKPLTGHTTAKSGKTKWCIFVKISNGK